MNYEQVTLPAPVVTIPNRTDDLRALEKEKVLLQCELKQSKEAQSKLENEIQQYKLKIEQLHQENKDCNEKQESLQKLQLSIETEYQSLKDKFSQQ